DVRSTLVDTLRGEGRRLISAADGYEALRLLVEHPVDLLITDIRMPGLNGFQLARQAKLMQPTLHVMYLSAYHWEAEQKAGPIFGTVLRKPFRAAELAREIDRELSALH